MQQNINIISTVVFLTAVIDYSLLTLVLISMLSFALFFCFICCHFLFIIMSYKCSKFSGSRDILSTMLILQERVLSGVVHLEIAFSEQEEEMHRRCPRDHLHLQSF